MMRRLLCLIGIHKSKCHNFTNLGTYITCNDCGRRLWP